MDDSPDPEGKKLESFGKMAEIQKTQIQRTKETESKFLNKDLQKQTEDMEDEF